MEFIRLAHLLTDQAWGTGMPHETKRWASGKATGAKAPLPMQTSTSRTRLEAPLHTTRARHQGALMLTSLRLVLLRNLPIVEGCILLRFTLHVAVFS